MSNDFPSDFNWFIGSSQPSSVDHMDMATDDPIAVGTALASRAAPRTDPSERC
jgi:hypothetical protein